LYGCWYNSNQAKKVLADLCKILTNGGLPKTKGGAPLTGMNHIEVNPEELIQVSKYFDDAIHNLKHIKSSMSLKLLELEIFTLPWGAKCRIDRKWNDAEEQMARCMEWLGKDAEYLRNAAEKFQEVDNRGFDPKTNEERVKETEIETNPFKPSKDSKLYSTWTFLENLENSFNQSFLDTAETAWYMASPSMVMVDIAKNREAIYNQVSENIMKCYNDPLWALKEEKEKFIKEFWNGDAASRGNYLGPYFFDGVLTLATFGMAKGAKTVGKMGKDVIDDAKKISTATKGTPSAAKIVPGENGYYGTVGKSGNNKVRNMPGGNSSATEFYDNITQGYTKETVYPNGAKVRTMPDGTEITFRAKSNSDGTPAVDINKGSTYKPQKIHFVN
jgi:uncharacterized protein YukE